MKIGKSDIISIERGAGKIEYERWVSFIDSHKDYFIWYEDTEDGKSNLLNINAVPEWAKEGVLYRLSKTTVYSTNKLVKKPFDFVIRYFREEGILRIDIEKPMTREIGSVLLEMANYLEATLLKDGKEVIDISVIERLA